MLDPLVMPLTLTTETTPKNASPCNHIIIYKSLWLNPFWLKLPTWKQATQIRSVSWINQFLTMRTLDSITGLTIFLVITLLPTVQVTPLLLVDHILSFPTLLKQYLTIVKYAQTIDPNVQRVLLKLLRNGLFVSSWRVGAYYLTADTAEKDLGYPQVWRLGLILFKSIINQRLRCLTMYQLETESIKYHCNSANCTLTEF